ncbi:hypothetical protein [Naumannella halotolerans]|uniref:DUF732 domain-containing protein n=1 Tax=Naumannella halotolerans TaxID=993414 RepID=A0A4R7J9M3_9ACTN|nr:hypothetical protein [Naumannella halotolerans]TDT34004.1 hypothetical protein CLV29_1647 [Naumannella halotolerans]
MTMKTFAGGLAAAALSATLLLSGCGGSEEESAADAPAAETAAPEAEPETGATSAESGESTEDHAESDDADSSGRPSEDEVATGLKTLLESTGTELPGEADQIISCMAGSLVASDMSDEGLQKIADGQAPTDAADTEAFSAALSDTSCYTGG